MANFSGCGFATESRCGLAIAHECDEAALAAPMHFEKFLIGDLSDLLPDGGICPAGAPVGLEELIVKRRQIAVNPAWQVHAIGDPRDRGFRYRKLGPKAMPHLLGNLTVQTADGVTPRRGVESEDRH